MKSPNFEQTKFQSVNKKLQYVNYFKPYANSENSAIPKSFAHSSGNASHFNMLITPPKLLVQSWKLGFWGRKKGLLDLQSLHSLHRSCPQWIRMYSSCISMYLPILVRILKVMIRILQDCDFLLPPPQFYHGKLSRFNPSVDDC